MNKVLIFSILAIFLLHGCIYSVNQSAIKGNGTSTREFRAVTSFNKIEIASGAFSVYLSQGEVESVELEIDENLQQYVDVRNEGSTLVIEVKENVTFDNKTKNNIFVTVQNIDLFSVTGACNLKTETPLNCESFTLNVQGVINGDLELYCTDFNVIIAGVSNFVVIGSAKELNIRLEGVGNFNSSKFIAAKVDVENSGVGSVNIHATEELSMTNTGIGSVTYSGEAEIKKIDASGIGKIKKAE